MICRWRASLGWMVFLLAFSFGARSQTSTAETSLGGTSWQLVRFVGGDGGTLVPDDKSKYTVTFENDGRVSARVDCNRGVGTWKSSGPNQLEFGPLALTRAMCPAAEMSDHMTKDWQHVRSYTTKDGHLFLSLMADGGTYEFERGGSPQEQSPVASKGPVEWNCTHPEGGSDTLRTTFYQTTPAMVLVEHDNQARPAFRVISADGGKYEGQDVMFWEARGEAMATWSGLSFSCKPR